MIAVPTALVLRAVDALVMRAGRAKIARLGNASTIAMVMAHVLGGFASAMLAMLVPTAPSWPATNASTALA